MINATFPYVLQAPQRLLDKAWMWKLKEAEIFSRREAFSGPGGKRAMSVEYSVLVCWNKHDKLSGLNSRHLLSLSFGG